MQGIIFDTQRKVPVFTNGRYLFLNKTVHVLISPVYCSVFQVIWQQ